eukprot:2950158-Amphidinium_carterae.1
MSVYERFWLDSETPPTSPRVPLLVFLAKGCGTSRVAEISESTTSNCCSQLTHLHHSYSVSIHASIPHSADATCVEVAQCAHGNILSDCTRTHPFLSARGCSAQVNPRCILVSRLPSVSKPLHANGSH